MARLKVLFLFCATIYHIQVECAKLNVPRVLIPLFNSFQVNFTLEVTDGGCYKWSSSRDDVVAVRGILGPGGCSSSAQVYSAPRLRNRHTAIILAEDLQTKQSLRCDVILDSIASLSVVTTTRELFVEEAPEAFEIRALDDQGNDFTTLEGVEFLWSLVSPLKNNDVIRLMTFSSSLYEASAALMALESRGARGHTALLEGVKTGSAKVIVKLPQPEYSSIPGVEVSLRVVANLLISPAEAAVLVGDSVRFSILQMKEGRLLHVEQPSSQYRLQILDQDTADLNPNTGVAIGKSLGDTRIILQDAGSDGTDTRPPEASLHCVEPLAIALMIRDRQGGPWGAQIHAPMQIQAQLLYQDDRIVHIGPETRILIELNSKRFSVHERTINGSVIVGTPTKLGVIQVTATLLSVAGKPHTPKLTVTGDLQVFEGIEIIPPQVVLPWFPTADHTDKHEIQMSAVGGDGTYSWRSEGAAAVVGPAGLLAATAPGKATVTAALPAHPYIHATASVLVYSPAYMEVLWTQGEGAVESGIPIHIALYAQQPGTSDIIPFTSCRQLPFDIDTLEGVKFERVQPDATQLQDKPKDDACVILYAQCSEAGSALLNVRQGILNATVSVACHAPLKRLNPMVRNDKVVLAVGTSANVIYTGGPVLWSGGAEPLRYTSVQDLRIAQVKQLYTELHKGRQLYVYTVSCLKLGETEMTLKVVREEDEEVLLASASLSIACSAPHSLRLSLPPRDKQCPNNPQSQMSVLAESGPIEVQVLVLDSLGLPFYNATTLMASWTHLKEPQRLHIKLDAEFPKIPVTAYHYQMLSVSDLDVSPSGLVEVHLEVLSPKLSSSKASLHIKMVAPVQGPSGKVIIYLHPGNNVYIPISHGSGSFRFSTSNPGLAKVSLEGARISVRPLQEGQLTIAVVDLCQSTDNAIIQISIVTVAAISADLPPFIELQQGVQCSVTLYDRAGSVLPPRAEGAPPVLHSLMDSRLEVEAPAAQHAKYSVKGLEVGDAQLEFSASSARILVQTRVFPPLKLVPESVTILIGGSVQVTADGGPPPPAHLTYHTNNNAIKVTPSGTVEGVSLGTATVTGVATVPGVTGVVSRATASIKVIQLDGVVINAPTTKLLAGNTMPLWVTGIPDSLGPLQLGAVKPALKFHWSVSGEGHATITDVLNNTNINMDDADRVSVRLTAVRPGKIYIHLNVSTSSPLLGRKQWSASLDLLIAAPLLLEPSSDTPLRILMAQHSSTTIKTQLDTDKLHFTLSEESGGDPLVVVNGDGEVTSFGRTGRAVLYITSAEPAQEIVVAIEVCGVQYVMMDPSGFAGWTLAGVAALPEGLVMTLTLSQYDTLGRRLRGTSSRKLSHSSNRPDLLALEQHSHSNMQLTLTETGRSVLRISEDTDGRHLSDYVSFRVQSAISPKQIVATVGDMWCMHTSLRAASWSSWEPRAVAVYGTGLAQALQARPATTPLLLQTHSQLTMAVTASVSTRTADKIWFVETLADPVVTDQYSPIIHLVMTNHEQPDKSSNVISDDRDCLISALETFPFSCEMKTSGDSPPAAELAAQPVFDLKHGLYGCQVSWSPSNSTSRPLSNTSHVFISAVSGSTTSSQLSVKVIRAASWSPQTLTLSPPPASVATLTVTGEQHVLSGLQVLADNNAFIIEGPVRLSFVSHQYTVRAGSGAQQGHVRIYQPLTHQDTQVPVQLGYVPGVCEMGGAHALLDFLQGNQTLWLMLVFMVLVAAFTVLAYTNFVFPLLKKQTIGPVCPPSPDPMGLSPLRRTPGLPRPPLAQQSTYSPQHASSSPLHHRSGHLMDSPVYGDPTYVPSPDHRRTRRFL